MLAQLYKGLICVLTGCELVLVRDLNGTMRIAYIVSRFPKVTETFVLREMLELQKLGVEIELFSLIHEHESVRHDDATELETAGHYGNEHPVRQLVAQRHWLRRAPQEYRAVWRSAIAAHGRPGPEAGKAAATVAAAAAWAMDLQDAPVDRIHAHFATWPALAAWVVHRLTGIPYSFTIHAHDLYLDRPMLAEKLGDADFVVTISDYNLRFVRDLYGTALADKVVVVHCGVDVARWHHLERSAATDGRFEILAIGALEDYKGHRHLVEACSRLRAHGTDFRCRIVGEGPQRAQIEQLIRLLRLEDQVFLLGRRTSDDVERLLAEVDVLAHPSVVTARGKTEGIPVALMEAMASGVPVVATDVSGTTELVVDHVTGLVVPPADPASLCNALEELASSPTLARALSRAGQEQVERGFRLDDNASQLLELFGRAPR
jgi:colanic acid/amylovoran biosynthesis glycosyltransferase